MGNEGKTQGTSVTFSTIKIFYKCPEKIDKWKCLWEATDFLLPYVFFKKAQSKIMKAFKG